MNMRKSSKNSIITVLIVLTLVLTNFIVMVTPTVQATGSNFYVRIGATGSNNGSDWTNAWSSFSAINWSSVGAGSTIWIGGGTYGPLNVAKGGTAGNPLTFKRATVSAHGPDSGWNAAYDARVIIDGGDSLGAVTIGELGGTVQVDYVTIDGATKYGIWARNAMYGVKPLGPDNLANNLTLRYLELGGDTVATKLGEDGIQGLGNNLLVEYCYIHDNDTVATHGDGVQWFRGNNLTFRYNVFKNNGQMFMLSETAWGNDYVNNVSIYYNIFYNRGGDHYNGIALKLAPQVGYYFKVYNNVFDLEAINNGYNNIFNITDPDRTRFDFKNNAVIYSNAGFVSNVPHSYNGYDNSGTYMDYLIPTTETGKVEAADLGFVDVSSANYHLTTTSPLIGAGVNVGLTVDFDGNAISGTPNIGAFGSSTPTPTSTSTPTPTPTPTPSTTQSIFTTQIPAGYYNDSQYELGTKFKANIAGSITKVKIYTNSTEGGTHTVRIWKADGTLVSGPHSWSITSGTTGWKEFTLPSALSITANTDYIVSISNSTDKYYAATPGGFNSPINNGNLITYSGSGLYSTTLGSIPSTSYGNASYFRDIVFVP